MSAATQPGASAGGWHLPPDVDARVADRDRFEARRREYAAIPLTELRRRTAYYQNNMPRTRERSDYRLRVVLVPELWERLLEGARTPTRRLNEVIIECDFTRPSMFNRARSFESLEACKTTQASLRAEIERAAGLTDADLRGAVMRAVSEAMLGVPWEPEALVYDAAFYCLVVPELIDRVIARRGAPRSKYGDVVGAADGHPVVAW